LSVEIEENFPYDWMGIEERHSALDAGEGECCPNRYRRWQCAGRQYGKAQSELDSVFISLDCCCYPKDERANISEAVFSQCV